MENSLLVIVKTLSSLIVRLQNNDALGYKEGNELLNTLDELESQLEPIPLSDLLTAYQAARLLGISLPSFEFLVRNGEISATKTGRKVRYQRSDIEKYQLNKKASSTSDTRSIGSMY